MADSFIPSSRHFQVAVVDYVVGFIAKVRHEFRCGHTAAQLGEKMSRVWRQHLLGDAQPLRGERIPAVQVVEVLRVVQIDLVCSR